LTNFHGSVGAAGEQAVGGVHEDLAHALRNVLEDTLTAVLLGEGVEEAQIAQAPNLRKGKTI